MYNPLAEFTGAETISYLLADIDDTITTDGKLTPEAYAALWQAKECGIEVVPVTGRPAGWVDHIARMWPVRGVIGENGGFYFLMGEKKLEKRFLHNDHVRQSYRTRLAKLREEILLKVPGTSVASDQQYREYDLAIDFCEDVPPLELAQVEKIKHIFEEHGAHAKISSIHVNGWFGDFDKLSTAQLFIRDELHLDPVRDIAAFAFVGDSPNDEPMFRFFANTFGVANIMEFKSYLSTGPAFVTPSRGGAGFTELVDHLTRGRERK